MINFNNIGSYAFSSELDVLQVTASADITVTITMGGDEVLNSTYTPVNGVVTLYHLNKLLAPLISDVMADFTITAGGTSKTVHVVHAAVLVNEAAATFLPSFFLSMVMTERDTMSGRHECVSFVATEALAVNVVAICTYVDGSTVSTATKSVASGLTAGALHAVDVSPDLFVDNALGTLVSYMVVAGERRMRYRMRPTVASEVAMIFRNAFGAWETFYLPGSRATEPDYTRETANVNGMFTLYNINESQQWVSHSGILRPGGVTLAHDLARSKDVFLLDGDTAGDAVVITAVDVKTTGDWDENADFTFTWRRANSLTALLEAQRPPKLFDDTFDETYD